MTNPSPTMLDRSLAADEARTAALVAAFGLLILAMLASFAQFGVLGQLVDPADPAATTRNIAASSGLFAAGIGAFAVVAILDIVVAWGVYRLLRPFHLGLARFVGWSRVVYAVVLASALVGLFQAAQLVGSASAEDLASAGLQAQVASEVDLFGSRWDVGLVAFGFHLLGLGGLLQRSRDFPRVLSALVIIAGAGYLADSLGRLFVPGYTLTISVFTFVGEALLIVWFFKIAIKGSRATPSAAATTTAPVQPSKAAFS